MSESVRAVRLGGVRGRGLVDRDGCACRFRGTGMWSAGRGDSDPILGVGVVGPAVRRGRRPRAVSCGARLPHAECIAAPSPAGPRPGRQKGPRVPSRSPSYVSISS